MWKEWLKWGVLGGVTMFPLVRLWQEYHPVYFVTIHGRSMHPTLEPGQFWLCFASSQFQRGDVVIFRSPTSPDSLFVKRIVAMEGDLVLSNRISNFRTTGLPSVFWIPKGYVWMEGDNSTNSNDSNAFGPVPYSSLLASVRYCVSPFSLSPPDNYEIPPNRVMIAPLPPSPINYWRVREHLHDAPALSDQLIERLQGTE